MLVKYKIPGAVGGWTLLFDEANGDANEKFAPTFRDSINKSAGYGAANLLKIPMGNTDGQVQFHWSQNYATAAAALAAIPALRALFKGVTRHLQITIGATNVFLPNANLSGSSHDPRGREVWHTLTFETDDITTTEPA